jgi:hypothetical protein
MAKYAAASQARYPEHVGIDVRTWEGAAFSERDAEGNALLPSPPDATKAAESKQGAPSEASFTSTTVSQTASRNQRRRGNIVSRTPRTNPCPLQGLETCEPT